MKDKANVKIKKNEDGTFEKVTTFETKQQISLEKLELEKASLEKRLKELDEDIKELKKLGVENETTSVVEENDDRNNKDKSKDKIDAEV